MTKNGIAGAVAQGFILLKNLKLSTIFVILCFFIGSHQKVKLQMEHSWQKWLQNFNGSKSFISFFPFLEFFRDFVGDNSCLFLNLGLF